MQGDLKKTYTRSYRISVFKRKMKKKTMTLRRREDVEMSKVCCSILQSIPEKDSLLDMSGAGPKLDADLEDATGGSKDIGSMQDETTQAIFCNTQDCDEESETRIKRPKTAIDCPETLEANAHSPASPSGSPDRHIPCTSIGESCDHVPLGYLKVPTEVDLQDQNSMRELMNGEDGRSPEDIAKDVKDLKSGVCFLSQLLEDIIACKQGLQDACFEMLGHHSCDALQMERLIDGAESLERYRAMLGRMTTERDTIVARHLAMLFSRATQLLGSISLDGIWQGLRGLDALVSSIVPGEHIESRDRTIKALEEELQSVTIKASIQEEQIEYLVRQADVLRRNNHALEHCLGMISASCTSLSKHVSDVEADRKHMKSLLQIIQSQSSTKARELLADVCGIRDMIECLRSEASTCADVPRIRELIRDSIDEIVSGYESQIDALKTSKYGLEEQIQELSHEASELRERNASLSESNRYMEEEIELKNTYAKEMESTFEELIKSNKFYEDQLIKSDDALRSLKEKQAKSSVGFASEVERMRKAHVKECGMLRLRIEELELEIANKNN